MRLQIAVLSALLIGWSALSSTAKAEMLCAERENVIQGLERGYAEIPIARGLAANGVLIEVFTSPAGTFTIVMTHPGGPSCLLIVGDHWNGLVTKVTGNPI